LVDEGGERTVEPVACATMLCSTFVSGDRISCTFCHASGSLIFSSVLSHLQLAGPA
jgi:hypothetical protein